MNMKPQLISYAPHFIHLVKISEGIISNLNFLLGIFQVS